MYRGSLIYRKDSSGTLTLESAGFDGGRITPGGVRYHVTDHLGSVVMVIDGATGTPLERGTYGEYGQRSHLAGTQGRYHFSGKEDQGPEFGIPYTDFGARHYSPSLRRWLVQDPLSEKYYGISPYAYCAGNPVNMVDPDGKFPDFIWDAVNVAIDVSSLVDNIKHGKWGAAALDTGGLILDAAAAVVPFVPGGVGTAIKAARTADKVADTSKAIKTVDKAIDSTEAIKDVDRVTDAVKKVHGNSMASSKAQHAYDIIDKETGTPVKTGVSGGPIRKDGKSVRAESQVRKWNEREGYERYESVIYYYEPEGPGARGRIYNVERKRANMYKKRGYLLNTKFHSKP